MTGKTKICPFCQIEFVPENASKYCSARCRRGMYAKEKRESQKNRVFVCAYCGKDFTADQKRKYCCDECRLRAEGRLRGVKPRTRKKATLSLAQINELARAAGMNYGQYVAKYGI